MRSNEVGNSHVRVNNVVLEQGVFPWYQKPPERVARRGLKRKNIQPGKPERLHVGSHGRGRMVFGMKSGTGALGESISLNKRAAEKILEAAGFLSCEVPVAGAGIKAFAAR